MSSCKVPFILVSLSRKMIFLDTFLFSDLISNFMKVILVAAEFFHADGWTDRHYEANSFFFLQFCESAS